MGWSGWSTYRLSDRRLSRWNLGPYLFLFYLKKAPLGNNIKVLFLRGFFGTIAAFSVYMFAKSPAGGRDDFINLSPIFTVIIAHFYLKEKPTFSMGLLIFSFVGVVMVRGDVQPVPDMMLLGIGAALFGAMAYTCVRQLRTTEDPLVVILYFPLITVPLISPLWPMNGKHLKAWLARSIWYRWTPRWLSTVWRLPISWRLRPKWWFLTTRVFFGEFCWDG